MEKTLVLIKPDAVQRGLVGDVITRFEKCGLKLVAMKMIYADPELAGKHYAEDEEWMKSVGEKSLKAYEEKGLDLGRTAIEHGRLVRQQLMDFISMSPVVGLVIEGHNAIKQVRKIVGPTNPEEALPGTIRGDYSFDNYELADPSKRPIQNLIHASSDPEEGKREIGLWFDKDEIHVWKRIDEDLIYRKGEDK